MCAELTLPPDLPEDPVLSYCPPSLSNFGLSLAPKRSEHDLEADLSLSRWAVAEHETQRNGGLGAPVAIADGPGQDASEQFLDTMPGPPPPGSLELSIPPEVDTTPAIGSGKKASQNVAPAYELVQLVGKGGMGEVWKARQSSLGRSVAVKRLRRDLWEGAGDDAESMRQSVEAEFRQEARVTALLEHPNIAPVHDLGLDASGSPLLAMKLIKGTPWDKMLKSDFERLSSEELLAKHLPILADVCQAVAFAHSRNVVHRDLKPAQVMVGEFGETLLMDWGLAVCMDEEGESMLDATQTPEQMRRNEVPLGLPSRDTASNPAGTPALMAPEQTDDNARRIGPWTDIYLLGGTLYFILTGSYPHKGPGGARGAMLRAQSGDIVPPEERVPERGVPSELSALALQAMSKAPNHRIASAMDFMVAIQDFMSGSTRRRESAEMAQEAAREMDELIAREDQLSAAGAYSAFEAVGGKLDRALQLWPGNVAASKTRSRVLAARAQAEIKQGDLISAQIHIKELRRGERVPGIDVGALEAQLAAAEKKREEAAKQRLAMAAVAVVFLVIAIVVGAIGFVSTQTASQKTELTELKAALAQQQADLAKGEAIDAKRQKEIAEEEKKKAEIALREAEKAKAEAIAAKAEAEQAQNTMDRQLGAFNFLFGDPSSHKARGLVRLSQDPEARLPGEVRKQLLQAALDKMAAILEQGGEPFEDQMAAAEVFDGVKEHGAPSNARIDNLLNAGLDQIKQAKGEQSYDYALAMEQLAFLFEQQDRDSYSVAWLKKSLEVRKRILSGGGGGGGGGSPSSSFTWSAPDPSASSSPFGPPPSSGRTTGYDPHGGGIPAGSLQGPGGGRGGQRGGPPGPPPPPGGYGGQQGGYGHPQGGYGGRQQGGYGHPQGGYGPPPPGGGYGGQQQGGYGPPPPPGGGYGGQQGPGGGYGPPGGQQGGGFPGPPGGFPGPPSGPRGLGGPPGGGPGGGFGPPDAPFGGGPGGGPRGPRKQPWELFDTKTLILRLQAKGVADQELLTLARDVGVI